MRNKRPEPSPGLLKRFLTCQCGAEEEKVIALWYRSLGRERGRLQLSTEEENALKRKLWLAIRAVISGAARSGSNQPRRPERYKHLFIRRRMYDLINPFFNL